MRIHDNVQRSADISPILTGIGICADVDAIYWISQADVVKNPMAPDPRDPASRAHTDRTLDRTDLDSYIPDLRLVLGFIPGQPTEGIKIRPRDLR